MLCAIVKDLGWTHGGASGVGWQQTASPVGKKQRIEQFGLATRELARHGNREAIILQCLAKRPEDRPASARELKRMLEECGVERWSQSTAAKWWEAHGPTLRAGSVPTQKTSTAKTTMAVDVGRRAK